MLVRRLKRDEIKLIWSIDRSESVDGIYLFRDNELKLVSRNYELNGWPLDQLESDTLWLLDCFDRGGYFYGAFDKEKLIGVVVLDNRFFGAPCDQLQLLFLHVDNSNRGNGLGRQLFEFALEKACDLGAGRLYISSNSTANTVEFYQHLGCLVAKKPDSRLLALEPSDIHFNFFTPF